MRILSRGLGPDHLEVAWCHNDLAITFFSRGDYREALVHFQEAARIKRKAVGVDDRDYLMAENNIAYIYLCMGHSAIARSILEQCAAKVARSRADPYTAAQIYDSYGAVLQVEHDAVRARPYLARALALQESLLTPDAPSIGGTLEHLARVDLDLGRVSDAKIEIERSVAIARKREDPSSETMALRLRTYAAVMSRSTVASRR
jgi:tetratricopeptide (TPR) repeat protein